MYLSKIKIKNFRSLKSVDLHILPITIIYGENGSGKSSILEALYLLKQSLGDNYLSTNGVINFGSYSDIVINRDNNKWVSIGIGLTFKRNEFQKYLLSSTSETLDYFKNIRKINFPITYIEYEASFRINDGPLELIQVLKVNKHRLIEVRYERIKGQDREKVVIPNIKAFPNHSHHRHS